jgi:hypothetical protein
VSCRWARERVRPGHLAVARVERQSPRERPRFGFLAPFRDQAKSIAWDYLAHYSHPIPGIDQRVSELVVNCPNGSQVRLFGADNPNALRGLYVDGLVLVEYGLMPPRIYTEVLRPTLSDRQGWALASRNATLAAQPAYTIHTERVEDSPPEYVAESEFGGFGRY